MQLRRRAPVYAPPPADQLETVFADDDYIVFNKPSGLLSVPGRGIEKADCVASYARQKYGQAHIVHRLDMDTSGLIVLARTDLARRHLARAFQARQIIKHYQALVSGIPTAASGTIDQPIARYSRQRPLRHLEAGGLSAKTCWKKLEADADSQICRVHLQPETGRSHQLRLHMKSIGHPVLGDPLYGDPSTFSRLALHACYLSFQHHDGVKLCQFKSAPSF